MKDNDPDGLQETSELFDQLDIGDISDGVIDTSDRSMKLPYTFFEFTKVIESVDKRERFCALILHALSGSSADGKNYTMDLVNDGKTLRFTSHMDRVAEKFSDTSVFKAALKQKLSFGDSGGILDMGDVELITNAFDTKVRDETENFNRYKEWTMDFVLPTDKPGRDIIMRFPVVKMMKAGRVIEGLKKDLLHSFVTIVCLDWEDIESAKVKTPSKGIFLDIDDSPFSDESIQNDVNDVNKKRRLKAITNNLNNKLT